jgi:hypothetical protein
VWVHDVISALEEDEAPNDEAWIVELVVSGCPKIDAEPEG